ncbi:toxin-antitoxin system HicB family antitoxin [Umezawaea sp. Da 62-37]|uniref:toxin-antitoxin system HicB family antitoxin n=1 Tax=Umezawaea sp. Da 62-37 TaxID=3075927 RepID=UPI0028F6CF16|nr:Arc family DNA-binding protein [Umezawaea sp. Da 62-37]WNV88269.1 Arc family DNA-binding protein [Umezawaea sp. Da 62-37]
MDLSTYIDNLGSELALLAETGGEEARALVERLSGSLESAIRLTLLETLSAAADEITLDLAPGSVELRLRGREPNFVVTLPPAEQPAEAAVPREREIPARVEEAVAGADDGATARINFRLPEQLKASIEEAAAKEGRSVNAWLVRVASTALRPPDRSPRPESGSPGKRGNSRYTGWVQ